MIEKKQLCGAGVGLRAQHYTELLHADRAPVPWVEILANNFLARGGVSPANLERICARYPISFHCIGMSLGSSDPLNTDYLMRLRALIDRFQPAQVSDHLAWVGVNGRYVHELVPMPYTQESLEHMANRIEQGLAFQSLIETLDLDEDITRMFPEFVQRGWVSGLDIS